MIEYWWNIDKIWYLKSSLHLWIIFWAFFSKIKKKIDKLEFECFRKYGKWSIFSNGASGPFSIFPKKWEKLKTSSKGTSYVKERSNSYTIFLHDKQTNVEVEESILVPCSSVYLKHTVLISFQFKSNWFIIYLVNLFTVGLDLYDFCLFSCFIWQEGYIWTNTGTAIMGVTWRREIW